MPSRSSLPVRARQYSWSSRHGESLRPMQSLARSNSHLPIHVETSDRDVQTTLLHVKTSAAATKRIGRFGNTPSGEERRCAFTGKRIWPSRERCVLRSPTDVLPAAGPRPAGRAGSSPSADPTLPRRCYEQFTAFPNRLARPPLLVVGALAEQQCACPYSSRQASAMSRPAGCL